MKFNEVFSRNRAEEFPDDVYKKYVLPLGYDDFNLKKMTKASIVIGGRGYGKTMFLKYHCHQTTFSNKKNKVTLDDVNTLGLYWRPDTSFSQHLTESWLGKYWSTAFKTYMALSIIIEFVSLVNNLVGNNSPFKSIKEALQNVLLPVGITEALSIKDEIKIIDSEEVLQGKLFSLCNWINSPLSEHPPFSLDAKIALDILIAKIHQVTKDILRPNFHIFIDEFENLTEAQQEIINTLLKHGTMPLLFSVAYKKNAKISHKTLSDERVVEQHDFRIIDLEQLFLNNFDIFAGEILALRLSDYMQYSEQDKLITIFTSEECISHRRTKDYQDLIRKLANTFLPERSSKEIAQIVLNDESLKRKLFSMMDYGLSKNKTKLKNLDFIDEEYPEASLINGALLNRKTVSPKEIHAEFINYKLGLPTKYKSWIPNNLVGVILYLYNRLPNKICPVYSGYKQFIYLSRGNIRHFLELCHQSILKTITYESTGSRVIPSMDIEVQSYATLRTSELEMEKIGDFGAHGMHLKRVAKRLGSIFNACQARRSQSESEINHFTMDLTDISLLSHNVKEILNEALVWSVLIEQKGTKSKTSETLEFNDYLLHPVLAPVFGISHRKKRKIKFTKSEVELIFVGSDDDFSALLKKYGSKWELEDIYNALNENNSSTQLGLL